MGKTDRIQAITGNGAINNKVCKGIRKFQSLGHVIQKEETKKIEATIIWNPKGVDTVKKRGGRTKYSIINRDV